MTKTPAWRRYLRFWHTNIAEDLDDELRFHMEMRVDEYMARGMSEDDARRSATARLGDIDAARTECIALGRASERHVRRTAYFEDLRTDIRFALRSLGRSPGWTAVALLTIALGVGATTTVFSVADTLLIRTIPYPDASRIFMVLREFTVDRKTAFAGVPYAAVREWRNNARTIEAAVPFSRTSGQLGTGPDAIEVHAAVIDTSFLAFAGVRPLLGRNFTGDEITTGGPGAILLTEQFWRSLYGGSPDVIGRVVRFGGQSRTIVGVVPASLYIPDFKAERANVLLPLVLTPHNYGGGIMVRLKVGISPVVATTELDAILKRAHVVNMKREPMTMRLRLTRPQDRLEIRQALVMLTGAVALLLLVAFTNVAHLLLARNAARQQELAVRHALGARRARLLRQLVTESLVLAVIGGALAVFVGWAGLRLLAAARPATLVALSYVSNSHGIVSIAAVLAIICGLVIGILAALRTTHRDLGTSLRVGGSTTSLTGRRVRASLVVGEVALSTTLLVGALLLIHAVFDLQRTQLGFDDRGLYQISFSTAETETPARNAALGALIRARATSIPGLEGVTLGSAPASNGFVMLSTFETPERPANGDVSRSTAENFVTPDYFSVMRMPLIAGRTFDAGSLARNEVVISRSLSSEVWPAGDAIGHRFRNAIGSPDGSARPWLTVIGVVPDVVANLIDGDAQPAIYLPLGTANGIAPLIVRLRGKDPVVRLRKFVKSVQPNGSKAEIENVRQNIDQSIAEPLFTMHVLVAFAALSVMLAAIGLFGVISYNVGQRTREIGVRMALGATRGSVAWLVVGDGIRLAVLGIGVGLLGAVAATRIIQNLLHGVSRLDPFSFGLGAMVLLAISVAACIVPMLRATSIDPAIAVRTE